MNKRVLLFSALVVATGTAFFIAWQRLHESLIVPAVAAARDQGTRLPQHQITGVDLIQMRGVWAAWALAAILGYWYLERQRKATKLGASAVFGLYVLPLLTTTAMLVIGSQS